MIRLNLKIFWLVNILAFSGDFLILNTGYHAILQVIQLLLQIYLLLWNLECYNIIDCHGVTKSCAA